MEKIQEQVTRLAMRFEALKCRVDLLEQECAEKSEPGLKQIADVCIILDGAPGHESGRFVEVEDADGNSIKLGEWRERDDGLWSLDIRAELS